MNGETRFNESFLSYKGFKHLKLSLLVAFVVLVVYLWHDPGERRTEARGLVTRLVD